MHGSIRTSSCPGCGGRYGLERVLGLLAEADAPACPACGEILKPDVVFFGELLPPDEIERAFELARRARLLLVVGSALEVHPVAGLPRETLARAARSRSSTSGRRPFDAQASLRLESSAGEVLPAVVAQLRGEQAQQAQDAS